MALQASKDEVVPATQRSYEVQRYAKGRWTVDTVADDKEVAIEMAKSLMNGRRPPSGVRVMAVEFKDIGKFSEISVYRSSMADQSNPKPAAVKPKIEIKSKASGNARDFKQGAPLPAKAKRSRFKSMMLTLQIAFGLGVTLAAFEAVWLMMR